MTSVKKSSIEILIANEIKLKLLKHKRSKKWLANSLGMDYGKVKRVLSETSNQQLSLSVADNMLFLLGSNLREVMSSQVIKLLRKDIESDIDKYDTIRD